MSEEKVAVPVCKVPLTPEQYHIMREKGTEPPFDNKYWDEHREGVYHCACCDQPLFRSDAKFDSGTGWPSFWEPVSPACVEALPDTSHGRVRTEVVCSRCHSHLGHQLYRDPGLGIGVF